MFREAQKSYIDDGNDIYRKTGRFPSKFELGYEPTVEEDSERAAEAFANTTSDLTEKLATVNVQAKVTARKKVEDLKDMDPGRLTLGHLNQEGAQRVTGERIEKQFQQFLRGSTCSKPQGARAAQNAAWKVL
jgi:hypothetical protein